jgi:hypothetical protein
MAHLRPENHTGRLRRPSRGFKPMQQVLLTTSLLQLAVQGQVCGTCLPAT